MEHDHAPLIRELGGPAAVARGLGRSLSPAAVWNWTKRGVPWRYRPAVADLASAAGKTVPADFLAPASDAA